MREIVTDRTAAGPHETKWTNNKKKKNRLVALLRSSHIQTMKTMTNVATLINKEAAKLDKLLPRCKDHPALVDDDVAKAEVAVDALLLMLLLVLVELAEAVVVVPVGGRTVDVSTAAERSSVVVGVITEVGIERDVAGGVVPEMESEDADDDDVPGEEIRVMAKAGLVSPESPNKTMR